MTTRREFLGTVAGAAAMAYGANAGEVPAADEVPPLTVISGKPRERGRAYGRKFKDGIHRFLDREIYKAFTQKPSPKDDLLKYAGACAKTVKEVCPIVHDELEGVAEGADLKLEEAVLLTLHEELYHRGVLPKVEHCTAVAVGPPDTTDGTYVGQTWDWMQSVYGLSSMLEWRRNEGPSVLAYSYPGLWVGAGVNAAGLALCWTSANLGGKKLGVRVGLPSYVLLTHLLYQESLGDAVKEAMRDKHAGWFTFVMADGDGKLVNVEGSPEGVAVETGRGRMARVSYGTRQMTATPKDKPVGLHPRCRQMLDLLEGAAGKVSRQTLQGFFEDPKHGICVGKGTIDMMVFDTKRKTAHVSRGPSYKVAWKEFAFGKS